MRLCLLWMEKTVWLFMTWFVQILLFLRHTYSFVFQIKICVCTCSICFLYDLGQSQQCKETDVRANRERFLQITELVITIRARYASRDHLFQRFVRFIFSISIPKSSPIINPTPTSIQVTSGPEIHWNSFPCSSPNRQSQFCLLLYYQCPSGRI